MTTEQQTFVIVGAGLAGAGAAEALRTDGFTGRVVLLGEETERPYNRPPLSKDYLQGKSEKDKVYVHPKAWYAEHNIELRLDTHVTGLDLAAHHVTVTGGERIGYAKLLLATGSNVRRLNVPGAEFDGVYYLRRLADCEAIKAAFATAERVAIIGGGWIGLETAAAARAADCAVTIIEMGDLPLLNVLGREVAEIYAALHSAHGVTLRLGAGVDEITGTNRRAAGVHLADGSVIDADAVVVGVGITPNTALAEVAGLHVDNGVVVDEHLATSDPDVVAAGDVANAYYPTCTPTCAWSTGRPRSTSQRWPRPPCWDAARPMTTCPTSSPISARWAWSTPATLPTATMTRWPSAATRPRVSTSPSGCMTVGCWPA